MSYYAHKTLSDIPVGCGCLGALSVTDLEGAVTTAEVNLAAAKATAANSQNGVEEVKRKLAEVTAAAATASSSPGAQAAISAQRSAISQALSQAQAQSSIDQQKVVFAEQALTAARAALDSARIMSVPTKSGEPESIDSSRPILWAGIGIGVAALAVGVFVAIRKRK